MEVKLKTNTFALLLLCSTGVSAASYHSFSTLDYINADYGDGFLFETEYFIKPQPMAGVLDEFGYLNIDDNVHFSIDTLGNDNQYNLGGEVYFNNGVFALAEYHNSDEFDQVQAGLGYLINDDFKVSLSYLDIDNQDSEWLASIGYNHQLNDLDYVAVSFDSQLDLDVWTIAGRYFAAINNNQFIALDLEHTDGKGESETSIFANYYLNQAISLGLGAQDSNLAIKAKYYVDSNFAITASYNDVANEARVGITGQF